jgi:nucleotidyltransferase substrate binding protein (TIGR01987 family)
MKKVDVELKFGKLKKAFGRLKEASDRAIDDLDKDGVIQRFEFTVELLWKTIKAILEYNKLECFAPRDCIKQAFRNGIIDDDDIILDMLDDRNASSHIYNEQESEQIFARIKDVYIKSIEKTIDKISEKL